ncbi:MAG: DUF6259 domain-containing protein [Planctomycetota bacterium]
MAGLHPGLEGSLAMASLPDIHYRLIDGPSSGEVANTSGETHPAAIRGKARPGDNGGLRLDGNGSHLLIDASEDLSIGEDGLTLMATVRFADAGVMPGQPDAHGTLFFKNEEFLFGRTAFGKGRGNALYFNTYDGGWAPMRDSVGGELPANEWVHVAAIVKRNNDIAQGNVGYLVRLFINGEEVLSREVRGRTIATTQRPVDIGKGWGGPWQFRGDVAEVKVFRRAITEREFQMHLAQEDLAPVVRDHFATPHPQYDTLLGQARAAAEHSNELHRLVTVVEQARHNAATEQSLLAPLQTIIGLAQAQDADPINRFLEQHPAFQFIRNEALEARFYTCPDRGTVFCGLFDLQRNTELLGSQRDLWTFDYQKGDATRLRGLRSTEDAITTRLEIDPSGQSAVLHWARSPDDTSPLGFTARAQFRLTGNRLAMEFDMDTDNRGGAVVREVLFPNLVLRRLGDTPGRILVPFMGGAAQSAQSAYKEVYPSGKASMQFMAYYDDERGVYIGFEDPKAQSKEIAASGVQADGSFSCRWYVPAVPGSSTQQFAIGGQAVVEPFAGDWFDAAQIYKRFAQQADWWPESRNRSDTPDWYRELTFWVRSDGTRGKSPWTAAKEIEDFREYLGLPMGVHTYHWAGPHDQMYPRFTPLPGYSDWVSRMQAQGIYIKPYLNGRLWDQKHPDYKSVGLGATARNLAGEVMTEQYGRHVFSVMDPTTDLWQQTMLEFTSQTADLGVGGLYLDQIAAAEPAISYEARPNHVPGDGAAWLQQGYWPLLTKLRQHLATHHPQTILDSEDTAEPYMHLLDGMLPWRFSFNPENVPAFHAIYAGRVQLVGRVGWRGIAMYPKLAEQLLYGEQLGWFKDSVLRHRRAMLPLFIKKLAHTRHTFLPFFNEGDMLRPLSHDSELLMITGDWGWTYKIEDTTPAVMHSVWGLGNSAVALFVNTSGQPVSVEMGGLHRSLPFDSSSVQLIEYQEGTGSTTQQVDPRQPRDVSVPGYSVVAWLIHDPAQAGGLPDGIESRAEQLFQSLSRFDQDKGMTPQKKLAFYNRLNPWSVPEAESVAAWSPETTFVTEWFDATRAPKVLGARIEEDAIRHINPDAILSFGAVDFGPARSGNVSIEVDVAVDRADAGDIEFLHVTRDGEEGEIFASASLEPTGGFTTFKVQRFPVTNELSGQRNVVIRFKGSRSGICNLRRWRVVVEP